MFTIIQGDAYDIGIVIRAEDAALSAADIRQLRVVLGGTVKTYPDGGITYADGVWRYPMTQEESLALRPGAATLTVRMEFSAAQLKGYVSRQQIIVQACPDRAVMQTAPAAADADGDVPTVTVDLGDMQALVVALEGVKIGADGAPGEKGEKGDPGEKGEPGAAGETGAQGAPGEKGDKGDPFVYADFTPEQLAALKGEKGDKGDQGAQGEPGTPGAKGDKGDKGDTGAGFKVLGYYGSVSALEAAVTSPNVGDAYGVGTSQPYDIYILDGTTGAWVNNGPLQGAKGEKGDKGDQGEQGIQGVPGEQGVQGIQGVPGADGAPGAKGDKGDPGAKGDKGDTGAPGADGITPTIGANGNWYLGTTDTGLPSRGAAGPPGAAGKDGTNGTNGKDGAAAGFGTVTVTVDNNVGTPEATVTASGTNTAKNFAFAFKNLKGAKGDKGNPGADGAPGSDANVTKTNIEAALKDDPLEIAAGGTGAATAAAARTNLGAQAKVKTASITLPVASWTGSDPYTQTVKISGVTAKSRIDLNPSAAVLAAAMEGGYGLVIGNNNGTVTAYAVGAKPPADITVQISITEVT